MGGRTSRSKGHTSGKNTVGCGTQRRLSVTVPKQVGGTVRRNELEDSLNIRVFILLNLQLLTFEGLYQVSANSIFPFFKDHFVLLKEE